MPLTNDQRLVRITITSDPDNSGNRRDHVFEMVAGDDSTGLSVQEELRTGTVAPGGIDADVLNSLYSEITGGDSLNEDVTLDLGANQFAVTLDFQGWEGATDLDGNPLQWGDSGDSSTLTKTDATGEGPLTQMQVFMFVLKNSRIDSMPPEVGGPVASDGPAKLEYGQYHADGIYDPMDVVFENPGATHMGASPSTYDGSLTCIAAADLGEYFDAQARTKRGAR